MKKVIILHRYLVNKGGAERVALDDHNLLLELGYRSKILCLFRCKKSWEGNNIESVLEKKPKNIFIKLIGNFKIILRILVYKPEYLLTSSSPLIGLLSKLIGSKVIYLDHHPITMSPFGTLRSLKILEKKISKYYPESFDFNNYNLSKDINTLISQFKLYLSYFSYSFFDKVVVLSNYSKLEKRNLLNKESYISVPYFNKSFVNLEYIKKVKLKKKYILSVSRLHENKNIENIIEGFLESDLKNNGFKLIIVGDGPLKNKLKKSIKNSDNIELIGQVSDDALLSLYAEAYMFVSLQYADYNLTAIEAMLANCQIVVPHILYLGKSQYINDKNINFIKEISSKEELSETFKKIAKLYIENKPYEILNLDFYNYLSCKERRIKELLS